MPNHNQPTTSLIPNGTIVTAYEDLYRLVSWAPAGNLPVVLDSTHTPWLLFINEDGDGYAGTIACPDDGIPDRCDLEDLPDRDPLRVVFNGDHHNAEWPTNTDTYTEERA